MKGIQESGILPAAKHFLVTVLTNEISIYLFSINSLGTEEWDNSFEKYTQA